MTGHDIRCLREARADGSIFAYWTVPAGQVSRVAELAAAAGANLTEVPLAEEQAISGVQSDRPRVIFLTPCDCQPEAQPERKPEPEIGGYL